MKTIAELNKERILIRKTNPDRARVLGALVDRAAKAAKNQNREATVEDLQAAALGIVKEIKGDIAMLEGHLSNPSAADSIAAYKAELALYDEFIPKMLDEQAIRTWLTKFDESFFVKANYGAIMKEAKTVDGMDCGVLSQVLKEKIK